MIANKKEFGGGLVMMVGFWIVFAILLSPVFPGQEKKVNMLDYMDSMYNSISKKSAYYIPEIVKKADKLKGENFSVEIKVEDKQSAPRIATMLRTSGATVVEGEDKLKVSGDLGVVLNGAMADTELAYNNNGEALQARHGADAKQVMFDWHNTLSAIEKSFTKQEKFAQSTTLNKAKTKAVETAFNYYGIEAQSIKDKAVLVVASLVGYVIYTMWFGFAILFMFEGWGLKLEH
ncbi:MAG: hypothetical protein WCZ86_10020 [Desulfurivibrionaceae bacterium]|jgi:hypothetical protein